jgi:ferredoxin-nitrite reductase
MPLDRHHFSQFPAFHGEGVFGLSAPSLDRKVQSIKGQNTTPDRPIAVPIDACPGLFYPTFAKDGRLIRIRTPGGNLSSEQARVLAALGDRFNQPLQVTNRANLQMRGLPAEIPIEVLQQLQSSGLAARMSAIDHLRNIMASPTAGIDSAQIIDTTPFVKELDAYLSSHLELAELSAKFSVGFDGGERVTIANHNDILLKAIDPTHFSLYLVGVPVGVIKAEDCISTIATIATVYLEASQSYQGTRKLRLKQLIQEIGAPELCDRARILIQSPPNLGDLGGGSERKSTAHIGTHPQRDADRHYIGITLPLGRLEPSQLKGLADLSDRWGNGTLRLTPWQNLIIPNIPHTVLPQVQSQIKSLHLHHSPLHIHSSLIACAGITCASSFTDTQKDALALAEYLDRHITLDLPITIHLSGCPKSCAYHGVSDLTLVGTLIDDRPTYQLFVGARDRPFGQALSLILPENLPHTILKMLQLYQRHSPQQSFREFIDRHSQTQLQQWFDASQGGI